LEADLASRAELMLAQMLGYGRAMVRVTADLDFTRTSRKSITYDPEMKVKRSERTKTVSRTTPRTDPLGPAGTPSNLTVASSNATPTKTQSEKEEENETEYETPQTVDDISEAVGTIKRLTVAVMADLDSQPTSGQNASGTTAVTKEQVEAIVKQAVGFDEQRTDQIEVLVTKLAGVPALDPSEVPSTPFWDRYSSLIRNASLGLASLVALVLGLLILRRLQPAPAPTHSAEAPQAERARQIVDLATQASANPEVVGRIIRAWLKQSAAGASASVPFVAPSKPAAAAPISPRPAAVRRAA
jgi:flagellar M-ring protein FliF